MSCLSACSEIQTSYSDELPSFGDSGKSPQRVLRDEEVQGWTPQQIPYLENERIQLVSPSQIQSLTPEQVQAFAPDQMSQLDSTQVQALASQGSKASLRDLTQEQLAGLEKTFFCIHRLTPLEQFNALTPEQFEAMSRTGRFNFHLMDKLYGHRLKGVEVRQVDS